MSSKVEQHKYIPEGYFPAGSISTDEIGGNFIMTLGGINAYDINGNPIHVYLSYEGVSHVDYCHHDYETSINLLDSVMLPPLIDAHDHPVPYNLSNSDDIFGKYQHLMGSFESRFQWNPLWRNKGISLSKKEKEFVSVFPKTGDCDMLRYTALLKLPASVIQGYEQRHLDACDSAFGAQPLRWANQDVGEEIWIWNPSDRKDHRTQYRLEKMRALNGKSIRVIHCAEGFSGIPDIEREIEAAYYAGFFEGEDIQSTVIIHGTGLSDDDLRIMGEKGWGIIWSPVSQITLYGPDGTLDVPRVMAAGVKIGLGTDWALTGSKNILREMAVAQKVMVNRFGFDKAEAARLVLHMATETNAQILGLKNYAMIGQLGSRKKATDAINVEGALVFISKEVVLGDGFFNLEGLNETDVDLMLLKGNEFFGNTDIMEELGGYRQPPKNLNLSEDCKNQGVSKSILEINNISTWRLGDFEDVEARIRTVFPSAPAIIDCAGDEEEFEVPKEMPLSYETDAYIDAIEKDLDNAFPGAGTAICVGDGYPRRYQSIPKEWKDIPEIQILLKSKQAPGTTRELE
jgi:hypothetical protein